ncbi:MAG: hypothetical protein GDA68_02275 [Nitrospira sp. CR2.1]|nr:hypothetical protein [Nitrospira sp. CR2.1]
MANLYKPVYHHSWAIVIGINEYQKSPPLTYACNDAESVRSVLIEKLNFPSQNIIVLKDAEATKDRILDEFISLREKASHLDDRVIFFFAGHGHTVQGNRGSVGYLVPVCGEADRLNTLIRWDEITRDADLIPAKHIFFIMDACYSGLAMQRSIPPGIKRFVSDSLQRPARQVLTAGKADQLVADSGGPSGGNSIFTGYLIEGLSGKASNEEGILTANTLMAYVYQRVGQHLSSRQTPAYGHIDGDGDLVLLMPQQEHLNNDLSSDYILETIREFPEVSDQGSLAPVRKSLAAARGYMDPVHANYGRNDLTSKLGEPSVRGQRSIERAFSWLGVLVEPTANEIISVNLSDKAANQDFSGWIKPNAEVHERFGLPSERRTTFNSLLFFREWEYEGKWGRYLNLNSDGSLEYGDTKNTFLEVEGLRLFKLLQIIGLTWQLLFLAKNILIDAGYRSGARLTLSLVGSRDTVLADFSQEPGKNNNIWRDPLTDPFGRSDITAKQKCTDANLKIEHEFVIGRFGYDDSITIMQSIARKIELAYNHQHSPRCFNVDTDVFPWAQYSNAQRW